MEKRVNVRVEHIKHSKCRQEFLDRVKSNAQKKVEAAKSGEKVILKRKPAQPREARHIGLKNNVPQTLTALPCEYKHCSSSSIQRGCTYTGAHLLTVLQTRPPSKRRPRSSLGLVRCGCDDASDPDLAIQGAKTL